MGVNFLIMWAVIGPITRAVITETRVSTLAPWCCSDGYDKPCVWSLDSAFDDLSLVIFRQPTVDN